MLRSISTWRSISRPNPLEVTAPAAGLHRFDVTNGQFAGSMTTILPANAAIVTTDRFSTDTRTWNKMWRTEIRADGCAHGQRAAG